MDRTIYCDIVSIDRKLFSSPIHHLVITASQGDLGIHPGHAPLLALLKPGLARVVHTDGSEEVMYISGGFIEVQPHRVMVLADFAERAIELDELEARTAMLHAKEHIGSSQGSFEHNRALNELTRASARLRAIAESRRKVHIIGRKSR